MLQGTQPTILLIEADPSLRRLITLGLQHRGVHVITASSLASLPPLETQAPSLLILDIDGGIHSDWSLLTTIQTHPSLAALPVITLAWECPPLPVSAAVRDQSQKALSGCTACLTKPFDARTLHTTIEQLLLAVPFPETPPLAISPAPLSAKATPPSIWPVITAVGLLLTFIGLMGLLALIILGLSIVLIALLLWTLDTTSNRRPTPISFTP